MPRKKLTKEDKVKKETPKKKPQRKTSVKNRKLQEAATMASVCDYMGKKCYGPIKFYAVEDNTTGIKILTEATGKKSPSVMLSDDFIEIRENEIKTGVFPPDWLIIKTKIDLDLSELTVNDETYNITKRPYAQSWVYFIKVPDIESYQQDIINAFVLAILVDRQKEDQKEENGEKTEGEKGLGEEDLGLTV